jgi:hypothetical protein
MAQPAEERSNKKSTYQRYRHLRWLLVYQLQSPKPDLFRVALGLFLAGAAGPLHLLYTPTSASWLNHEELCFAIITQQAIRRGSFFIGKEMIGKFV